ncbi:NAD(P)-dependent oxidoreductase [Halobacteriales archaeon QS_1_68_17]|nr:MAG: NAD(P)-dependent oxidoreductase [Halobacteriales archaeon QS_1_68_17]
MRVAILGCGYVGIELGRLLALDHEVVGVRRSESGVGAIERAGFEAVRADVGDPGDLAGVPDADAVVFAASSGGRGAAAAREIYVEGLRTAIEAFAARSEPPDRLVYTSSTGVYGDHGGDWVDEDTEIDPTTEKTRVLAEAERVAVETTADHGIDGTVARLSGLYGPDRYRLDRYLDGPVTEGYLNMVHRRDAAGAIGHLLTADLARDEVVLVTDDEPASKWEFADWLADQCGVERPPKQTTAERLAADDLSAAAKRRIETSKRCSNRKLRALGYEFAYPTFREGYREAIAAYRAARG